jgi:glycerophosphoryl diester phosphodiesterase
VIFFAHRGASGHAPENTLLSVKTALTMGAAWIEVDVYLAEGKLVVIHDRRLERTTNGSGDVTQKPLSYLRSLDAGKGEKIPYLTEVIDMVTGRAGINIELKGPDTAVPTVKLLLSYIKDDPSLAGRFIVSSFDHQQLIRIKDIGQGLPTGANIYGLPLDNTKFAEPLGVSSVHAHINFVTQSFVDDAHYRGFRVFVFTVNQREELVRMENLGVDGVFTNYPELGN